MRFYFKLISAAAIALTAALTATRCGTALHGALHTDNSVLCICRWRPVSRAGNGLETGSPAARSELPPYDRVVHGFSLSLMYTTTTAASPERRVTEAGLH